MITHKCTFSSCGPVLLQVRVWCLVVKASQVQVMQQTRHCTQGPMEWAPWIACWETEEAAQLGGAAVASNRFLLIDTNFPSPPNDHSDLRGREKI